MSNKKESDSNVTTTDYHNSNFNKLKSNWYGWKNKLTITFIAKRASGVMTQKRLRQTNWNAG